MVINTSLRLPMHNKMFLGMKKKKDEEKIMVEKRKTCNVWLVHIGYF